MKLNLLAVAALIAAVAGCASAPTGQSLWNDVVSSESASLRGEKRWSQHYSESYQTMTRLTAQPRVFILRDHFYEMLGYAKAFDDGKITADEFTLLRTRSEAEFREKISGQPALVAMLPGESPPTSVGDVARAILGVGLGAAAAYSITAPRAASPITCTTGRPIGNTVQTICR